MTDKKFNLEDAVYQLSVLLMDETIGVIPKTLKKNFNEEYKKFDTITAWECLVYEVNCINTVGELHDYLVENLESLKAKDSNAIEWIDKKIEEIKPYNSELCRATLLELKEFLE